MKLYRSITEPIRLDTSWEARWSGSDQGLITAWERGREMSLTDPNLASTALAGQLIPLPWKGGVEKQLKTKKYGTLKYIAMWQGLRGENLNIDTEIEVTLTCTATKMDVCFTNDSAKFSEA